MLQKLKKQNQGFTIVEVMIVLAIAGLIILIIFLAVPALQRNARNNQRKNDASHLSGLINEYQSNNNGKLPVAIGTSTTATPPDLDLSKENFSLMTKPVTADIVSGTTALGDLSIMKVNTGATCQDNAVTAGGGARAYTVSYQVERTTGGTTGVAQCI